VIAPRGVDVWCPSVLEKKQAWGGNQRCGLKKKGNLFLKPGLLKGILGNKPNGLNRKKGKMQNKGDPSNLDQAYPKGKRTNCVGTSGGPDRPRTSLKGHREKG